jgi:hypothetical protein
MYIATAKKTAAPNDTTREATDFGQVKRPARALLGWMQREQAQRIQAGQRADANLPEHEERARRARISVGARPAGIDQTNLISEAPAELQEHIAALQKAPAASQYFQQGWRVCVADLRKVCALQPQIFTDDAVERTAGVQPGDLNGIAAISLPLPRSATLPVIFDQARQSWILSSANPNLRVVGNWNAEVQPGILGVGFGVSVMPSFVQVAHFSNRYLLRDGYHRAYGFLRAGISFVPILTREFEPFEDLGLPPGLLPTAAYLGDRPPLLTDFLNDDVSADVVLPATQKMIVVAGLELTTLG